MKYGKRRADDVLSRLLRNAQLRNENEVAFVAALRLDDANPPAMLLFRRCCFRANIILIRECVCMVDAYLSNAKFFANTIPCDNVRVEFGA
jgi:hypothetical protein